MAQENQQQQQQQQPTCPGNCLKCFPAQRQYCASQHALSNMRVLDRVMEALARMQTQMDALHGTVQDIAGRIESIQSGEAEVFATGGDSVGDPALFPREYDAPEAEG